MPTLNSNMIHQHNYNSIIPSFNSSAQSREAVMGHNPATKALIDSRTARVRRITSIPKLHYLRIHLLHQPCLTQKAQDGQLQLHSRCDTSTDAVSRKDLARIAYRPGAYTEEGYDIQVQKEMFLDKCKILYAYPRPWPHAYPC